MNVLRVLFLYSQFLKLAVVLKGIWAMVLCAVEYHNDDHYNIVYRKWEIYELIKVFGIMVDFVVCYIRFLGV